MANKQLVAPSELEQVVVRCAPRKKKKTKPRKQPQYGVVLHNDNMNSMEFVVVCLRKVFSHSMTKAIWLMFTVHFTGRAIVWAGTLELAELKAEQLKSCGPDPNGKPGVTALGVTVEELPG